MVSRLKKPCKNAEPGSAHAKRPAPKPGPRCITCHREVVKERREKARAKRIHDTYGLSVEDFTAIMEAQGWACAICRKPFVRKNGSVDHCHATEKLHGSRASVRGIIHGWENTILGRVGDNPEHLEAMAEYLRNPPARRVLS